MDENEFKSTYAEFNARPCVFAKAVLRRCCACSRARRVFIAEREAVACLSMGGHTRCRHLMELLRHNALFALRLTHLEDKLPHGKEMKVQCGGLFGLQAAVEAGHAERIADVNGLVDKTLVRYGRLEDLPFTEIVKAVVHYEPRGRRGDVQS